MKTIPSLSFSVTLSDTPVSPVSAQQKNISCNSPDESAKSVPNAVSTRAANVRGVAPPGMWIITIYSEYGRRPSSLDDRHPGL